LYWFVDVDIWSDIACPWCFIGKRRFEKALAGFAGREQVHITWRSFQLDPGLPEHYDGSEAEYLSSRKGVPVERARLMFSHVAGQAAGEGLHYDFDSLVVANSMRAHELLHLAGEHHVADAVKEALLSAHFERGADIGDLDVLVKIGLDAGLDSAEMRAALESGRYRAAVAADIEQARRLGIDAVPFFVFNGRYGVSGAQPSEVFAGALERASQN
jgi:predicted DsbA family dithiol-disulfide isomerase